MKIQIHDQLWQAILSVLQEAPAKVSRAVLNSLENQSLFKVIKDEIIKEATATPKATEEGVKEESKPDIEKKDA